MITSSEWGLGDAPLPAALARFALDITTTVPVTIVRILLFKVV